MSKAASASNPDLDRVYILGMRYMQLAMKARLNGNKLLSEHYQDAFKEIVDLVGKGKIEEATRTPQEDVMEVLHKVNDGRIALKNELNRVKLTPANEASGQIYEALKSSVASCKVLRFCLEKGAKPPPIEPKMLNYKYQAINTNVLPTDIHLRINSVNIDDPNKNSIYYFRILPPTGSDPQPIFSEHIVSGNIGLNFQIRTFKAIKKNENEKQKRIREDKITRTLKRSLIIQLVSESKKAFGGIKESIIGIASIQMKIFESISSVKQEIVMEPTPDTPKGATTSIKFEINLHSPLIKPELKTGKVGYYVVVKNAQIDLPGKPKKRALNQLSKEELLELMPKLKVKRSLEDWELQRWMSLHLLKHLIDETKDTINVLTENNVLVTPKLENQLNVLQPKFEELKNKLGSKQISIIDYKTMIKTQLLEDKAEILKRGPQTAEGKALLERLNIMKGEFQKIIASTK